MEEMIEIMEVQAAPLKANLIFENVKAYDVNKFDVKLGESFRIELENVPGDKDIRWFSDADPVLSIIVEPGGAAAQLTSTNKGVSEIQLQYNNSVVKTFYVEVYDVIATSLNIEVKGKSLK